MIESPDPDDDATVVAERVDQEAAIDLSEGMDGADAGWKDTLRSEPRRLETSRHGQFHSASIEPEVGGR